MSVQRHPYAEKQMGRMRLKNLSFGDQKSNPKCYSKQMVDLGCRLGRKNLLAGGLPYTCQTRRVGPCKIAGRSGPDQRRSDRPCPPRSSDVLQMARLSQCSGSHTFQPVASATEVPCHAARVVMGPQMWREIRRIAGRRTLASSYAHVNAALSERISIRTAVFVALS